LANIERSLIGGLHFFLRYASVVFAICFWKNISQVMEKHSIKVGPHRGVQGVFQIINRFDFSKYINFDMHLDIIYI
jgi:putative effector of murein hydrolase